MFRNPVTDLIIVVVVALLIFGPKRLPMLGRSLGQGLREFKEGITGENKESEAEERPALTPTVASDQVPQPTSAAPASPPSEPAPATPASSPRTEPESAEAVAQDRRS